MRLELPDSVLKTKVALVTRRSSPSYGLPEMTNSFVRLHFRSAGPLRRLERCQVEDHPLLVEYAAVPGGAMRKGAENQFRNQVEMVKIVHRICPADKPYTCNKRVVVSDVFGHSTGRVPHNKQVLHLESLPAGAPNGCSRIFFPAKAAHLLIGR